MATGCAYVRRVRGEEILTHKVKPAEDPHVIAYSAMLDVPRERVRDVARLLRIERRLRGTRHGSRALSCWHPAVLVLAWFRSKGDLPLVGAGFECLRRRLPLPLPLPRRGSSVDATPVSALE